MAKLIINDKDGNVLYSHPSVDEVKLAKLKGAYPFEADVVMATNWETTDPIVIQMSNAVSGKITPNVDKRYQDIVNLANSSAPVFAAPPATGGSKDLRILVRDSSTGTLKTRIITKVDWAGVNQLTLLDDGGGTVPSIDFSRKLTPVEADKFIFDMYQSPSGTVIDTLLPAGATFANPSFGTGSKIL